MAYQRKDQIGDLISVSCRVDEVNGRIASVVDQFGIWRQVRVDIRRGSGPRPRADETWLIDRSMGMWTFAARVNRQETPEIEGSTDENPALIALLAALDDLGIIKNSTTDTQLRAAHTHTHPHVHVVPSQSTLPGGADGHTHGIPAEDTTQGGSTTSTDIPET